MSIKVDEEDNIPIVASQKEEDKNRIFKLASSYYKFCEELKNTGNNNQNNIIVYIISKEFIDTFKQKINYEQSKIYLNDEKNEGNKNKFKEFLKKYSYNELYSILCADIKLYCDLTEIQNDLSKGFEFVNYYFLDNLEFEEENFDDYISHYYKEENNIIIVFDDKSKLLINEIDGKITYHAIDAPIEKADTPLLQVKRSKTCAYFSNKRSKTLKEMSYLKTKSKTNFEKKEKKLI